MTSRVRRRVLPSVAAFAVLLAAVSAFAEGPSRALVLDRELQSVLAVDLASGSVLGTARLEAEPSVMFLSPDARRVLVFDRVEMKGKLIPLRIYPESSVKVTILETDPLRILSRIEVGHGVSFAAKEGLKTVVAVFGPPLFTADGKLALISLPGEEKGTYARPKDKTRDLAPPTLVTLDLESGQLRGRLALDRISERQWLLADDRTVVALHGVEDKPATPSELVFADLTSSTLLGRLPLEGPLHVGAPSPDGRHFYVMERTARKGAPSGTRVRVVSTASRGVVGTIEAPGRPHGLLRDADRDQVIAFTGTPLPEMRLLRGAEAVGTFPSVIPHAAALSPDGRLIVWGAVPGLNRDDETVAGRAWRLSGDGSTAPVSFSREALERGSGLEANCEALLADVDSFDRFVMTDPAMNGLVAEIRTVGSGVSGFLGALREVANHNWPFSLSVPGPGVASRAWRAVALYQEATLRTHLIDGEELWVFPTSRQPRKLGTKGSLERGTNLSLRFTAGNLMYVAGQFASGDVVTSDGSTIIGLEGKGVGLRRGAGAKPAVSQVKELVKPLQVLLLARR